MIIRELLTVFGVQYDVPGARQANASIEGLSHKLKTLATAFAGTAAAMSFKHWVEEQASFAQTLQRTSQRLGVQSDFLQELRYAAQQAGIEQLALDTAMQKFLIRTSEAAQGTGSAVNTLGELGVQLKDTTGHLRDPADLLAQTADGFARVQSQADKARIAQTLFEEEGVKLIDLLGSGSSALNRLRADAYQLGFVMDRETMSSAAEFGNELRRIGSVLRGVSYELLRAVLPALRAFAAFCEPIGKQLISLSRQTTLLKSALLVLGAAATAVAIQTAIALAPLILTFTGIAAAVGAVIIAVDELYNLFTGGDSMLGRFGEKMKHGIRNWLPMLGQDNQFMAVDFINRYLPERSQVQSNSVRQSHKQNIKVDVHVKTGAHPHEIGSEVARLVGLKLDEERRNAYLALVPE